LEHFHPVAPNILRQNFSVDTSNKAYVSDITNMLYWIYFPAWLSDGLPDLGIGKELVMEALQRIIKERRPQKGRWFIPMAVLSMRAMNTEQYQMKRAYPKHEWFWKLLR